MPRPGQNAYRKRQLEEATDEGSREMNERSWGPVLPIADLPADWEGEAEDGATYLALVARASAALPEYTSVPNPYRQQSPPPLGGYPDLVHGGYSPSVPVENTAGPSRHPALPKESWEDVFPIHWKSYRELIASRWPPSPPLPYPANYAPLPNLLSEPDWTHWLKGTPLTGKKKRRAKDARRARKIAVKEAEAAAEALAAMEEQAEVEAEVMEEQSQPEDAEEDMDIEVEQPVDPEEAVFNETQLLAEDDPIFDPPEPVVSVIQTFTTYQIIRIMKHITYTLEVALEPLERTVLPAQPDSPSDGLPASGNAETTPNPLSSHTARWVFALLAIVDEQLMGDQLSILRDLARVVMRVGGWRWVRAVVRGEIPPRSGDSSEAEEGGTNWELGERWKAARAALGDAAGTVEAQAGETPDERTKRRFPEYEESGVDETLARCWMIVHCISAGWAQRDLLEDLDTLFR